MGLSGSRSVRTKCPRMAGKSKTGMQDSLVRYDNTSHFSFRRAMDQKTARDNDDGVPKLSQRPFETPPDTPPIRNFPSKTTHPSMPGTEPGSKDTKPKGFFP
jgi:hypothetical protein